MTMNELKAKPNFSALLAAFDDSKIGVDATEWEHFMKICKHFYRRGDEPFKEVIKTTRFEKVYTLLEEYDDMYGLSSLPNRELLERMESEIGTTPLFILTEIELFESLPDDNDMGNKFVEYLQEALEMSDIRTLSLFLLKFYGIEMEQKERIEIKPLPSVIIKADSEKDWFDKLVDETTQAKIVFN